MDRSEFVAGLRDAAPTLPPNVPFGMLFGATAVQVGIDPAAATALSLFTFAAMAQMAAVELLRSGAELPVVLATILLINLRYVVYSASLAPEVRHLSRRWRTLIAYPLFDISYALSIAHFAETDREAGHRGWYFLGAALPMVGVFVTGTLAGALAGTALGGGLHLSFAVPLIFIALLIPSIDGLPGVLTAAGAAFVAVATAGLPFNLGLLAAAIVGTAVGALVDRSRSSGWST
ncbi:MAG: AzlC family ABC transporter permease [Haloquadratum sp.]